MSINILGASSVFSIVDGLYVTVLQAGVYKQCEVYGKDNQIFAKIAGGYVALSRDGICSKASLKWKWFSSRDERCASLGFGDLGWIVLCES